MESTLEHGKEGWSSSTATDHLQHLSRRTMSLPTRKSSGYLDIRKTLAHLRKVGGSPLVAAHIREA